jgi:hypothetical protein
MDRWIEIMFEYYLDELQASESQQRHGYGCRNMDNEDYANKNESITTYHEYYL